MSTEEYSQGPKTAGSRQVLRAACWPEAAEVDGLETCVSAERPKKYGKITCGDYVATKMRLGGEDTSET